MTGALGLIRTRFSKPIILAAALALGGAAFEAQAGPSESLVYLNRNFQDLPLVPFPGVTVASLKLPPGQYLMHVKLRYRGDPVGGASYGGCVFQGTGIGGLDASESRVELIGWPGTSDGVMMDYLVKNDGDDPNVWVQCFGDREVHIINTQFAAVLSIFELQP
jgi:hypothetical protein